MHESVRACFRTFNERFEGSVPHMYVDVKQLVTIGVGNLIDPLDVAVKLPFRFKSQPGCATPGAPASKQQIAAEWRRIKNDNSLAKKGYKACAPITELEIADDALNEIITKRLLDNEKYLKRQTPFKAWDSWPADAQLAVLSMAWAMGPAGIMKFPKFCAACAALDFRAAAGECKMSEAGNPGVKPRNRANYRLLCNAAIVHGAYNPQQRDCATLYYPQRLTRSKSLA